ncbi:conserved hypothetical protein [Perkinsus marinus ATCC 50983]|uniref:Queuosine 5'-phosphate N-glycosylase/hydrolase n=1 Tax=Perkinsus marinus (strain ATCC 50983 / TXsc) TaxID=423536 RepID=C5LVB4_PERM5|nr:conserved hypothetical protein [Perkinsus marinus ATCC 50983]EEQ99352.1 conserved hypothetical protein [Perkinsus marinus ATCC 50983]|eukprot:XP_002766635.1 conserved hypothetical protein [Perkinsus marinus ATCC 50983]
MDRLAEVTADEICDWFNHGAGIVNEKDGWRPQEFPLISERVRLVREVARGLRDKYHASALELVESADGSALRLMRILSAQFSGFRDQAIDPDTGGQVFLYKRAQICTADIWGAFRRDGKSVREKLNFRDMRALTMFPDYRVPQLLRHKGILIYSSRLENIIDSRQTVPAGSRTELEIRACTVHACHEIVEIAQREDIFDVTLDWLLWQEGEAVRDEIKPHHLGHVHLTRALDKVKGSANVKLVHEPYSVYDQPMRTPPKGQLVIEYLSDVYGIDRSHLEDPKFNASLATARTLGELVDVDDFTWLGGQVLMK